MQGEARESVMGDGKSDTTPLRFDRSLRVIVAEYDGQPIYDRAQHIVVLPAGLTRPQIESVGRQLRLRP